MNIFGGNLRRLGNGPNLPTPQFLKLADMTLVSGGANVTSATDVNNGIRFVLTGAAGAAQTPATAAVWVTSTIKDQYGNGVNPWWLVLDTMHMLVQEKKRPTVTPGLVRCGILVMNTADPTTCTEGYGCYLSYPSTTTRKVGAVRVTGVGTWTDAVTATPTTNCGGAWCAPGIAGLTALANISVRSVDATGDPAVPQGANAVIVPAADANQTLTQNRTLGVPISWRVGVWAGWEAAGGTNGVDFTADFLYYLMGRPGGGGGA